MLDNYVAFAIRYKISPADAYVIPALCERVASKIALSVDLLLAEAMRNKPLGEYLAKAAHNVAEADRAEMQAMSAR